MATPDEALEWRPIQDFPGYRISNTGLVWSDWLARTNHRSPLMRLQRALFAPSERRTGEKNYLYVCLWRWQKGAGKARRIAVHRLVAIAFIGPAPSEDHEVAHNDGNGLNNHASNLRWATAKENQGDRYKHGTGQRGERNWSARLTSDDVLDIRYLLDEGEASVKFLAEHYGVHTSCINMIHQNRSWQHILPPEAKRPPRHMAEP